MDICTRPPVRSPDIHGQGHFQAPRGHRLHNGVDFAVYAGSAILAPCCAIVHKIGWPYSPEDPIKGNLRFVALEVVGGYMLRFLYVKPIVAAGSFIERGQVIGYSQTLQAAYPNITEHVHFDVKIGGVYIDPVKFLADTKG